MINRVLFTASTFSHLASFHLPYLRAFTQLGWQVDVACGGTPVAGLPVHRAIRVPFEKAMTSPKNLAALSLLRREIMAGGYTLISCHTALAAFFTRLAVMGLSKRPLVVCTAHGYLFDESTKPHKRLLLSWAERLCAPVTDLLMTMNRWDTAFAQSNHLGNRVLSIPGMGVDFAPLQGGDGRAGVALRQELGFAASDFLLLYGAEFSTRKSQSTLLHALVALPPQVCLLLPGDGALHDGCISLAQQLGLKGRVAFPGHVSDMAAWYQAANAVVASSRSEGLPFHVMEAMSCALPIVASDVKGHRDLIVHGDTGLLFPYGDSAGCAQQVKRLLEEDGLAQGLGARAAQSVARYDLDTVLPQVMSAYQQLLPLAPKVSA